MTVGFFLGISLIIAGLYMYYNNGQVRSMNLVLNMVKKLGFKQKKAKIVLIGLDNSGKSTLAETLEYGRFQPYGNGYSSTYI